MAELANRRHETFALLVAGGARGVEAAPQAGYRGRRHRETPHELLKRPELRARIEELQRDIRAEFDLQTLMARNLLLADACQLRDDALGTLAALDRRHPPARRAPLAGAHGDARPETEARLGAPRGSVTTRLRSAFGDALPCASAPSLARSPSLTPPGAER